MFEWSNANDSVNADNTATAVCAHSILNIRQVVGKLNTKNELFK